ncbi:MAG: hypothetical protein Q4D06_05575 [Coriobacteriia bacterium]|nr:hypothetical protein [Coriobacteriia bacterium]
MEFLDVIGADGGRGVVAGRVDQPQALRYLGHTGQQMDPELQERFQGHVRACEEEMRASYCWRILPVELGMRYGLPVTLVAGGALELPGMRLARHLRGAVAVVLVAATLGFDCQRQLDQLGAVSPTDQLLRSTCASTLVESGLDFARTELDRMLAPAALHTGPPYAPGYGDLPVDVQPAFVELLGAGRSIGLSTTQANMLVPEKSVTACLGVFPADMTPPDERVNAVPCDNCSNRYSCKLRMKGLTCYD